MERPIIAPIKGKDIETPYEVKKVQWEPVRSIQASCDSSIEGLQSVVCDSMRSTFYLPAGTKAISLPGSVTQERLGCSLESACLDSLTLVKLPDGRQLIRRGEDHYDLEEINHDQALVDYAMNLMTHPGRVHLQALPPIGCN